MPELGFTSFAKRDCATKTLTFYPIHENYYFFLGGNRRYLSTQYMS